MALLSMRARKFYQRTGRKIIIDGNSTAVYDKSKGNLTKKNQSKASNGFEDASEKAMCAIDGSGFDWSAMAEDEIQANMALMAFSDSEVSNEKSCSKSCVLNYESLKKQYDDLLVKLDDTAFKAATYKRGLSILEAQVVKYKESEVLFSEEIALLKRSVGHKDYLMGLVKTELEKVKEEKEGFEFKLTKFEKSSKDLDALLASQVTDKSKKGFGYNVVPSPHPLILNRPTPLDLSYSGLAEFAQPEVNEYGPRDSSLKLGVKDEEDVESYPKEERKMMDLLLPEKESVKTVKPSRRSVRAIRRLNDKGFVDSGCSRHMSAKGGRITGKGTIKTDKLDFEDVYFVKELEVQTLFVSVSQIVVPKRTCSFYDTECLVLSPNFKLPDENQTLLKIPRQNNIFSWVFFLRTKDETSEILINFIKEIENLVDKKVKIIRSDNGTEFKNNVMNEFCREKEAVSTTCYVQNRVLVVKPHNKTPYELCRGIKPAIGLHETLWIVHVMGLTKHIASSVCLFAYFNSLIRGCLDGILSVTRLFGWCIIRGLAMFLRLAVIAAKTHDLEWDVQAVQEMVSAVRVRMEVHIKSVTPPDDIVLARVIERITSNTSY
ncbi:ribonuclease H-like domain-containing protein [Tanacetum coccineum]